MKQGLLQWALAWSLVGFAGHASGQSENADYIGIGEDSQWEWWGTARVRFDGVYDLPGGREDLERGRLHGYIGGRYQFGSAWEFGAAVKLASGTEGNRDNRRNLDNEEEDGIEPGELYISYDTGARLFRAGKSDIPFKLTGVVWDHDFRPTGISYLQDHDVRGFDRLTFAAGYYAPQHIDESESRLAAIQARYHYRAGAPRSFSASLGYLEFDDLDEVVADGRTRTNRRAGGALVSDYELLDLVLESNVLIAERPLVTTVDLVKNLGADDLDEGARLSIRYGDTREDGQWEAGYSIQRIQRDAVMAAFNEDDWWFPTNMRGYSFWYGYSFSPNWRFKVATFFERRDDLDEGLERLLLDVHYRF